MEVILVMKWAWWGGKGRRGVRSKHKSLWDNSAAKERPHNKCSWGNIIVLWMDKLPRANQVDGRLRRVREDGAF